VAIGADAKSTFLAIVKGDASQAVTEFKKLGNTVEKSTKGAEGSVGKFKTMTSGAFAELKANAGMFAAGGAIAFAAYGKQVINAGVQIEAMGAKSKTVFGDQLGLMQRWSKQNANALGLTADEATAAGAAIADLLKPMGFSTKEATSQTMALMDLAGALSAWTGGQKSATEVSQTFTKAMLGEREELKALGISISEAEVQAELAARGQKNLTGAALAQAKALVTVDLITRKSTDAQKAWADGSMDGYKAANKASASLKEIEETIVKGLYPGLKKLVPVMADATKGMGGLLKAAGPLADLLGFAMKLEKFNPTNFVSWGQHLYNFATNADRSSESLTLLTASAEEVESFLVRNKFSAEESADAWAEWNKYQEIAADMARNTASEVGTLNDANKVNAQRTWEATQSVIDFGDAARESMARLQALNDELAGNKAAAEFRTMMTDAADEQERINKDFADGKITAQEYFDATIINAANAQQGIIDYGKEIDSLDPDVLTKIVTTYDPSNPQKTVDQIQAALDKERLYIKIQGIPVLSSEAKKLMEAGVPTNAGKKNTGQRANGGPISAGTPYLVGERGPELIVPSTSGMVLDATRTSRATTGGTTNVTLVVRQLPTERELIDLVNGIRRKQGPVI